MNYVVKHIAGSKTNEIGRMVMFFIYTGHIVKMCPEI